VFGRQADKSSTTCEKAGHFDQHRQSAAELLKTGKTSLRKRLLHWALAKIATWATADPSWQIVTIMFVTLKST
jgi:hypothetical protein